MKPQLLLILLLGLFLVADAPGAEAGKKATEKLDGTWTLIKAEVFGQASDVEGTKNTLTFKNDKITVHMPVANLDHEATYTVDPAKKPKQLDMMVTSGPSKGKTVLFIYELEGDTLKLCGADNSARRNSQLRKTTRMVN